MHSFTTRIFCSPRPHLCVCILCVCVCESWMTWTLIWRGLRLNSYSPSSFLSLSLILFKHPRRVVFIESIANPCCGYAANIKRKKAVKFKLLCSMPTYEIGSKKPEWKESLENGLYQLCFTWLCDCVCVWKEKSIHPAQVCRARRITHFTQSCVFCVMNVASLLASHFRIPISIVLRTCRDILLCIAQLSIR